MSNLTPGPITTTDSFVFADDGQPLVEIARSAEGAGIKGEGMDEWEFAVDGGGRIVGAGQVTEILERSADDDAIGTGDIADVFATDGTSGFVFGETMYIE